MFFMLSIVISILVFAVQLILCLKSRRRLLRILPGVLLFVYELVCWGMYWFARMEILGEIHSIEMGFTGVIFGMMGLYWAGGVVLAWVVYAVVKFIQKRRK